jgi:ankyrin repeat protein
VGAGHPTRYYRLTVNFSSIRSFYYNHQKKEGIMKQGFYLILALLLISACATPQKPSTTIHGAVKKEGLEDVKKYVEQGKIEDKDVNGFTPLMIAAYYGYTPVLTYLLENGANVDETDKNGWTALMYSASFDFIGDVKLLVDHKASLNIKNNKGHNALYYAEKYKYERIVKLLKEKGAK